MSDKADLKVMESPEPCVDPEVLQYQILVQGSGDALTYIYLGTTTTQLHFDPPVSVETGNSKYNLSANFLLRPLGLKGVHGDDLWEIRSSVTPKVYARVKGRYDIIMDNPVEQEQQRFYFRDKRNGPVPMSEPIPENAFMSICFDDPYTKEQLFWHPNNLTSSNSPDRIVTGTEMLSGGPKEMAKFQFVPSIPELRRLVVAEENPTAASKRSGNGCVILLDLDSKL